jgi:hypothetical protein
MATIKIEDISAVFEVSALEAADVKGGPGWGSSMYQYSFEGTYTHYYSAPRAGPGREWPRSSGPSGRGPAHDNGITAKGVVDTEICNALAVFLGRVVPAPALNSPRYGGRPGCAILRRGVAPRGDLGRSL